MPDRSIFQAVWVAVSCSFSPVASFSFTLLVLCFHWLAGEWGVGDSSCCFFEHRFAERWPDLQTALATPVRHVCFLNPFLTAEEQGVVRREYHLTPATMPMAYTYEAPELAGDDLQARAPRIEGPTRRVTFQIILL